MNADAVVPPVEIKEEMVMRPKAQRHIGALDGIRGLAVLMVFADHYGDIALHNHSAILLIAQHIKATGWIGVDFFFALSGYLITGILWRTKHDKHRARNFYAKRVLRLLPVYYGVWAFLLCYVAMHTSLWQPRVFLAYLFYVGNFVAPYHQSVGPFLVAHFWSLAVEEQFYLLWPVVLWNMPNRRSALRLLGGAFAFSVLLKVAFLIFHVNLPVYFYTPTHMESITAGSFLALAFVEWPELCQRYAKLGFKVALAALVIAFVVYGGLADQNLAVDIVAFPLVAILGTSLIVRSQDPASPLSRLMNMRVLRFYGKISYGFYIYHYLLRNILKRFIYMPIHHVMKSHLLAGAIYFPLALIICTVISASSFYFYEKPFLRLKRRFESTPRLQEADRASATVNA